MASLYDDYRRQITTMKLDIIIINIEFVLWGLMLKLKGNAPIWLLVAPIALTTIVDSKEVKIYDN